MQGRSIRTNEVCCHLKCSMWTGTLLDGHICAKTVWNTVTAVDCSCFILFKMIIDWMNAKYFSFVTSYLSFQFTSILSILYVFSFATAFNASAFWFLRCRRECLIISRCWIDFWLLNLTQKYILIAYVIIPSLLHQQTCIAWVSIWNPSFLLPSEAILISIALILCWNLA